MLQTATIIRHILAIINTSHKVQTRIVIVKPHAMRLDRSNLLQEQKKCFEPMLSSYDRETELADQDRSVDNVLF